MNYVCKLPLKLSYACKSHNLGLGESGFINCASPAVHLMKRFRTRWFWRIFAVTPKRCRSWFHQIFRKLPSTVLANPAIDVSMLSSFRDHLVSTPWWFQLNLMLNSYGVLHLIKQGRRWARSCRICKLHFVIFDKIGDSDSFFPLI